MPRVVLFNKPCGVICQFSPSAGKQTLKDFVPITGIYPAGRLDTDSEGLLILTDDGALQNTISHPAKKWPKTYWVQVENIPDEAALMRLRTGVDLRRFRQRTGDGQSDRRTGGFMGTQAAHSGSPKHSDQLARNRDQRRQEPPGAADDGRGRLSHPAPDQVPDRSLDPGRTRFRPISPSPCRGDEALVRTTNL